MKKNINKIIMTLCITSLIGTSFACAEELKTEPKTVPVPTTIEEVDVDLKKLEKMTLEELRKVAVPVQESYLQDLGDGIKMVEEDLLPHDDKIYVYSRKNVDNKQQETYYRFLCVTEGFTSNSIEYNYYNWRFINGEVKMNKVVKSPGRNKELLKIIKEKKLNDKKVEEKETKNTNDIGRTPSSNGNNTNNTRNNGNSSNTKKYNKKRISGLNRFATAKAIGEEFNNSKVENVVISTAYDFNNALAGSVLAKKLNAPILLVGLNLEENRPTLDYIKEHLVSDGTVYILGNNDSISEDIINSIKTLGYKNVKRIEGDDIYKTNKAINDELNVVQGTPVIIVNSNSFADALSMSSIASIKSYPIIFTNENSLPFESKEIIRKIKPSKVYIAGGKGAVEDSIKNQIKDIVNISDADIMRIDGATRYETSLNIAKYFNLEGTKTIFATGENFPDALAGSVLSVKYNAPVILIDSDIVKQKEYLDSIKCNEIIILGGSSIINDNVIDELSR